MNGRRGIISSAVHCGRIGVNFGSTSASLPCSNVEDASRWSVATCGPAFAREQEIKALRSVCPFSEPCVPSSPPEVDSQMETPSRPEDAIYCAAPACFHRVCRAARLQGQLDADRTFGAPTSSLSPDLARVFVAEGARPITNEDKSMPILHTITSSDVSGSLREGLYVMMNTDPEAEDSD